MSPKARSPIERMIDASVRCLICGTQGIGNCDCWVELRCPKCKRTKTIQRDKTDPRKTAVVEVLCPDCDDNGEFPEVLYFDRSGKQLMTE